MHPGGGVFVAADAHYLGISAAPSGPLFVAADAARSRRGSDRIALVPDVEPYQPGRFDLRELPPLRAVLDGLAEMTLLIIDRLRRPGPGRTAPRSAPAPARSSASR